PDCRLQTEHRKVTAGYEQAVCAQSRVALDKIEVKQPMCSDSRKRRLEAFQIAEHRIAEDVIAAPGFTSRSGCDTGRGRTRTRLKSEKSMHISTRDRRGTTTIIRANSRAMAPTTIRPQ